MKYGEELYLYEEDYDELKKVIFNCSKYDENFASKIAPEIDIAIYEKLINYKNPLYFHKRLIFKIVRNVLNQPTLKEQCRKHICLFMQKVNINHALNNLRLPKYLQRYLNQRPELTLPIAQSRERDLSEISPKSSLPGEVETPDSRHKYK